MSLSGTELVIPVSVGELVDKLTILRLKSRRIRDETKLGNVTRELELLTRIFDNIVGGVEGLDASIAELAAVNEKLWDIEDALRDHERMGRFDEQFVALARSVYLTNDHRAQLKRSIDDITGSRLTEEKSYADYSDSVKGRRLGSP